MDVDSTEYQEFIPHLNRKSIDNFVNGLEKRLHKHAIKENETTPVMGNIGRPTGQTQMEPELCKCYSHDTECRAGEICKYK
eukprot:3841355-Amphidinium_carterae.4